MPQSGVDLTGLVLKPMIVNGSTIPTEYQIFNPPKTKELPEFFTTLTDYGLGANDT